MSDALLVVSVVGTIAFALSGVMAAAEAEMDWLGAVVLAAVAAIGGGTVRDVLARRTPIVLVGEIYAVAGLLGAVAQLGLREAGAGTSLQIWLSLLIIVAVRAVAVRCGLHLPRIKRG